MKMPYSIEERARAESDYTIAVVTLIHMAMREMDEERAATLLAHYFAVRQLLARGGDET